MCCIGMSTSPKVVKDQVALQRLGIKTTLEELLDEGSVEEPMGDEFSSFLRA